MDRQMDIHMDRQIDRRRDVYLIIDDNIEDIIINEINKGDNERRWMDRLMDRLLNGWTD